MTSEKFWMVWSPQGRGPTFKHPARASAENEAKRLARACPSQEFFVLKAVTGFTAIPIIPEEAERIVLVDNDGIPF